MSNAFQVGAIKASLILENGGFTRGIRDSIKQTGDLRKTFKDLKADIADVARDFTLVGAAITGVFAATVKAAANVEESANLFSVSMGDMADSTREWSEELALALGLNANSIRDVAGNLNVVVGNMGLAAEASVGMSKELTKLAFDMSSFYNLPHQAALEKLRAGILGESEPLKQLGIVLNETKTEAFAWANGIAEVGDKLNEQQKVVARYGLIMEQTKLAQGDLSRTTGSATNQFRQFQEQVLAVGQNIGKDLLPPVTAFMVKANNAITGIRIWAKENTALAATMAKIGAGTGVATLGLGSMAYGIVGVSKAFESLKKTAAVAWAVVYTPITATIAGIAAIGAGIYVARAVWKENFELMASIGKGAIDNVIANFGGLWNRIKEVAAGVVDFFRPAFNYLAESFASTMSMVGVDVSTWTQDMRSGMEILADEGKKVLSDVTTTWKADMESLPEGLKSFLETFTNAMGTRPDFEGYADLDLAGLMAGAQTMGDLGAATKAAGGEAKKAAEEMERLKESAMDMRLSLFPKEAYAEEVANITSLAAMFPEIMTGDAVQQGFLELFEQFKAEGLGAAEFLQEGMKVVPQSFQNEMLDAVAKWEIEAIDAAERIKAATDDANSMASIGNGISLDLELSGGGALQQMIRDMEDLKAAGRLDGDNTSLLSERYWSQFSEVPLSAVDEIIAGMKDIPPAAAKAFKDAAKEGAKMRKGMEFDKVAGDVGSIANAVGNLGPKFKDAANAGQVASTALSAAGKAVTGDWIGLTVEILNVIGLFGDATDQAEEELKGMAKVIDEIKEASDAWADSLTDKLVDAIKTGQFAWRDFVDEIMSDLLKIAVKELIVNQIIGAVGNILPFEDGGAFDKGHIVDSPEYFGTKSGPAVRGEAGTEVVMPAVRMGDGTLGVRSADGGGGGSQPIINIIDQRSTDSPPVDVKRSVRPDGQEIYDIVVGAWNKAAVVGDLDHGFMAQMSRMR